MLLLGYKKREPNRHNMVICRTEVVNIGKPHCLISVTKCNSSGEKAVSVHLPYKWNVMGMS